MASERDIEQFIGDSFSSVWDLELLVALLALPDEPPTPAVLVQRMRASDHVVEQGIAALVAAGIGVVEADGTIRFQPINPELEACAVAAADFYARFPGRARRIIVSRNSPGLTAFADAFRLRKD